MTDFMQEPLWEEEGKDPPLPKAPAPDKTDPLAAAGNAAMAYALPDKGPMPPPKTLPPPKPQAPAPAMAPPQDWETRLLDVLARLTSPDLETELAAFLDIAPTIPPEHVQSVAGAITSAFLKLPAAMRKPVRGTLVAALKRWPGLSLTRLILTRLGGLPVAIQTPPPSDS